MYVCAATLFVRFHKCNGGRGQDSAGSKLPFTCLHINVQSSLAFTIKLCILPFSPDMDQRFVAVF